MGTSRYVQGHLDSPTFWGGLTAKSTIGDISTRRRLAARIPHPDRLVSKYGPWIEEFARKETQFLNSAFDAFRQRCEWISARAIAAPRVSDSSFPYQELDERFQVWIHKNFPGDLAILSTSQTWAWNMGCARDTGGEGGEEWAAPCDVANA